jgi:hypothetical protein
MAVPDSVADLWRVPLASTETVQHAASRGTLTLPAVGGVAIVRAKSPGVQIGGFEKEMPSEEEPDAPEVEDWEPNRIPGVTNGYMQGQMVRRDGKVWVQPLYLPESSPGAKNGGSYADPSAPGSLWITNFVDEEPTWEAGAVYTQPRVVHWPNNGANGPVHRYQLQTASETALVGREPHQAYMWAVWLDLGAAP